MSKSEFLKLYKSRGFLHQCTDEEALDAWFSKGNKAVYIGFDCTATSLHVGSLVQIMILRMLQQLGHKPVILLGEGTTKIGDPSGKDESRQLLNADSIKTNMQGIQSVIEQFITVGDGPNDAVFVNNSQWLDGLSYIDFLRDVGRHFSVNRMLGFESVKQRLDREQNLSFLEFNYMLLQAYDFVELSKRFDCRVQIGGSDQWGNIVSGIDLARRLDDTQLFGLTTPLLTTASGAKMGKTAQGAVWLSANMLSVYDYWQFWRNVEDQDVGRFLRLFTELDVAEIERLEALEGADINQAKIVLANEATTLCHGRDAAKMAEETAQKTFEQGGVGQELPEWQVEQSQLSSGIPLVDALVETGLASSKGEARRLIRGGGARVNGEKCSQEDHMITVSDVNEESIVKLSSGKKKHAVIRSL